MQAISTRYMGPTDTRGARIAAVSASGERAAVPYDHGLDTYKNHERAAHALMKKLGWTGRVIGGSTKNGYCWVFASSGSDPRRSRKRRTR